MNTHIPTFENFLNEGRSPEVTYNEDPKAMLAFKESKGPYKARLVIYGSKNNTESIVFPGLGDRGLNMLVAGPGFRAEWAKQLGLDEDLYSQVTIDRNPNDLIALAKRLGFKKTRGDDYEKDVRLPEDALKSLISFFTPLVDKIQK